MTAKKVPETRVYMCLRTDKSGLEYTSQNSSAQTSHRFMTSHTLDDLYRTDLVKIIEDLSFYY